MKTFVRDWHDKLKKAIMYAITGITSQVGGAVAQVARSKVACSCRGRDDVKGAAWAERGCEVAVADMNDTKALADAFTPANGVQELNHNSATIMRRLPSITTPYSSSMAGISSIQPKVSMEAIRSSNGPEVRLLRGQISCTRMKQIIKHVSLQAAF
jgi:hypothetical protein